MDIKQFIPLAPYTSLQVGGPARYFTEITHESEVPEALGFAADQSLHIFILGGGSNLVVPDEGFPGLVIRLSIRGIDWTDDGDSVTAIAGSGEEWDAFVEAAVERGLSGIECLSGIPGLVGGTPVQNVGAYGQEVSETIRSVHAYDRQQKRIVQLSNAECSFRYRTSIFNTTERDRYIVLRVRFALSRDGKPAICYPDLQRYFAGSNSRPALSEIRKAVLEIRTGKGMVIVPGDPDCRSVKLVLQKIRS
ncbi:MAG: UDP-N-acetylmuramate dehydrogenase [Acidobacteria bacterium]|nr:UDP-N-acetylmuramate dehydrogenase [Acidobacteriota bacterium]